MAYGYGKRPLWQWILIYVVIGGLLYYGVYYFFLGGNSGSGYNSGNQNSAPAYQTTTPY